MQGEGQTTKYSYFNSMIDRLHISPGTGARCGLEFTSRMPTCPGLTNHNFYTDDQKNTKDPGLLAVLILYSRPYACFDTLNIPFFRYSTVLYSLYHL
jgi:hypothetical protein